MIELNRPDRVVFRSLWILAIQVLVHSVGGASGISSLTATADPLAWLGPEGQETRFASLAELQDFLQTARILQIKEIGVGVTRPRRLLLEKDGVRLHAHFQSHDDARDRVRLQSGVVELNYRDSYKFNIAAYELSRLLGMNTVPPSFPRTVRGESGAITVWLEGTFTEETRRTDHVSPPQPRHWSRQLVSMWVFDELVGNTDRNLGNILIDRDWKIWLIDHSRAFRLQKELKYSGHTIPGCERRLWEALKSVTDEQIRVALKPWLDTSEIKAVLRRRRLLVNHMETLIESKGLDVAIFDLDEDAVRVTGLDEFFVKAVSEL